MMNTCSPGSCITCNTAVFFIIFLVLVLLLIKVFSIIGARKSADKKVEGVVELSETLDTVLKAYKHKVDHTDPYVSSIPLNIFIDRSLVFENDLIFIHKHKYDLNRRRQLDRVLENYTICVNKLISDIKYRSKKDDEFLNSILDSEN